MLLAAAILIVFYKRREAVLAFTGACVIAAATAAVFLVSLLMLPNGPAVVAFNTAWSLIPITIMAGTAFAAWAVNRPAE